MAKKTASKAAPTTTKPKARGGSAPTKRPSKARALGPDQAQGPETAPPPHPPPLDLSEIIGQGRAVSLMRNAMACGRVHHAWLLSGPPGVGKFTAALAFAAALLDPTTSPDLAGVMRPEPGGSVARLLAAAAHPDLHVIRKELAAFSRDSSVRSGKQTTIPIEVVRQFLIEPAERAAALTPSGMASKVFIVDEAELLKGSGNAAQNALLKTLEEPPPGTVIILVTPSEDRLLPTIRSRAQRAVFAPLDDRDLAAWATARGLDPAAVAEALPLAEGSPGRLLALLQDGWLDAWRQLAPLFDATSRGQRPTGLGDRMAKLADAAAEAWVKADDRRSKDMANRAAAAQVFRLTAHHARSLMLEPDAAHRGVLAAEAIARAEQRLEANVMLGLVMEGLAADLAHAGRA